MTQRDLTQADLARAVGVSEGYMSDVLLARRPPLQVKHLLVLAEKYRMDKKKLLTARAWTLGKVDVPPFVKYEQVEEVIGALMERRE